MSQYKLLLLLFSTFQFLTLCQISSSLDFGVHKLASSFTVESHPSINPFRQSQQNHNYSSTPVAKFSTKFLKNSHPVQVFNPPPPLRWTQFPRQSVGNFQQNWVSPKPWRVQSNLGGSKKYEVPDKWQKKEERPIITERQDGVPIQNPVPFPVQQIQPQIIQPNLPFTNPVDPEEDTLTNLFYILLFILTTPILITLLIFPLISIPILLSPFTFLFILFVFTVLPTSLSTILSTSLLSGLNIYVNVNGTGNCTNTIVQPSSCTVTVNPASPPSCQPTLLPPCQLSIYSSDQCSWEIIPQPNTPIDFNTPYGNLSYIPLNPNYPCTIRVETGIVVTTPYTDVSITTPQCPFTDTNSTCALNPPTPYSNLAVNTGDFVCSHRSMRTDCGVQFRTPSLICSGSTTQPLCTPPCAADLCIT